MKNSLFSQKGEGTQRGLGSWVLPFGARRTLSRPLRRTLNSLVRALVNAIARHIIEYSFDCRRPATRSRHPQRHSVTNQPEDETIPTATTAEPRESFAAMSFNCFSYE